MAERLLACCVMENAPWTEALLVLIQGAKEQDWDASFLFVLSTA